jgi:ABC-type multidrug transport system fused ATPase/permease subunit
MSNRPRKRKKIRNFWRACRYLWPYRSKITVSVVAAIFVGFAMTGGLTTMIPIMRVMLSGDTMQALVYRRLAAQRLGVTFASDPTEIQKVQIIQVNNGPAKNAGMQVGDIISDAQLPPHFLPSPFAAKSDNLTFHAGEVLRRIAWAPGAQTELTISSRNWHGPVGLAPLRWYDPLLLDAVQILPVNPVAAVAAVFGLLACISLLGNVARYFQEHLSDKSAILAARDIRERLYDRVLRIPLSSLGTQGASDVTSRLITDVDTLQDGFKTVLGQSIQEPIKALMAFIFALSISLKLTVFIVILAPLMGLAMKKFGKKMRRASRAALRSSSVLLGQIEGTLVGIRVVKGFNAEKFERRRHGNILRALNSEQIRMSRIDAFSSPVMETLILLMAGLVVLVGTYLITVSKTLPATDFILVMISLAVIAESLRRASKVNNALQKSEAAATRIFETLDLLPEREQGLITARAVFGPEMAPKALPTLANSIEFQNLEFTYPNASTAAINGLNLRVSKGQSIAVVGRNGSGKTTLLALLERFFDPRAGRILVDGVDIRVASLTSLRRQISIVTQDSHIFPGTIAENIAYGEPLAAPSAPDTPQRHEIRQRIEQAARRAFAHEFILEKPGGYDFALEGLGNSLSGGQKQRLCIARAIYNPAPILILDEATSQVDAESEHLIHQAIESLIHERTTFVIAHRFSTIISADSIVVMDRGRIVGQGKHDELLASCPIYTQLYERQLIARG